MSLRPSVAVVGATGLVGQEIIRLLDRRRFPISELLPFCSGRSASRLLFHGRAHDVREVSMPALRKADLIFLASSEAIARRYGPPLAGEGLWVIDDSSEFRLDPAVPLVIPEVNAHTLSFHKRLIAGPNCTMTGAAVVGQALVRAAGARSVRIASYQAVSGAGKAALEEFKLQVLRLAQTFSGRMPPSETRLRAPIPVLPRRIACNLFPQVGRFDGGGNSSEENKVASELRKVWGLARLAISVTAVRVPVLRGHSLAMWLETCRPLSVPRARALLRSSPGVRLWPGQTYPTPIDVESSLPVHAGRVRRGTSAREICLWICSDNLLKGAALNSVQIAEILIRRGWLSRRPTRGSSMELKSRRWWRS